MNLFFYFITIKKYKKDVHYWLNHLNQLLEGEKEMKEIRPSIQYEIKHYVSDLKDFCESLMKGLIKLQDLTRCNQQFETYC